MTVTAGDEHCRRRFPFAVAAQKMPELTLSSVRRTESVKVGVAVDWRVGGVLSSGGAFGKCGDHGCCFACWEPCVAVGRSTLVSVYPFDKAKVLCGIAGASDGLDIKPGEFGPVPDGDGARSVHYGVRERMERCVQGVCSDAPG